MVWLKVSHRPQGAPLWHTTNNGVVSIDAHCDDPTLLCLRGRFAADVDRILGLPCEVKTPNADYRFRAVESRIR